MLLTEQERSREFISRAADRHGRKRSALIPILLAIQEEYGYVSEFAMQCVGDFLDLHAAEVYSVATFYHFINTKPKGRFVIRLSRDMSSIMKGAKAIAWQLEKDLGIKFGETTPDGMFSLQWTSCIGMNHEAPAMMVNNEVFSNLTPLRVHKIIEECTAEFNSRQPTVGDVGETFTNSLTYARHRMNAGAHRAVTMTPEEVVAELTASGLRGRGGAGFPTGMKWKLAAAAKGETKYIICNADEGEPGTFKDRIILTQFADIVFEGMTIAAYAVGASEGIIYLRAEYTFLHPHLEQVLKTRRDTGLLGKNILGKPGFNFDIRVQMGAGAYVCGEETALIESLEGRRGEPRNRPPFPVESGFNGMPTVVNNVETLASVSVILDRGAKWFASIGTEKSKGFKLFSISGDCKNPGVYELPWGITVNELLDLVGCEDAKAVQVGGYSGELLPPSAFNRRLAYEDLGIGGSVIIYGPNRDMLLVAENYLEFFVEESCGQCTPCREGNPVLLEGVRAMLKGECTNRRLEHLVSLGKSIQVSSKCGLGQTSPKVLLAINEHFHDEIMARPSARAQQA
ncbi:MAG: NAD(P)H-dependent oxidoreductase subunit E [Azoarcus sp.]|jgi:[NiFe] hydrogenase diaphorase moiety large subunit|nr:NAD(P)H-dependent oxidoreductase subunit E [Azoarcus sp.]